VDAPGSAAEHIYTNPFFYPDRAPQARGLLIDRLQEFLLESVRGFCFKVRQKRECSSREIIVSGLDIRITEAL
jgi:hypothetical protein